MTISSPGIGSNLDVNGIVTKLMSVEQVPLGNLKRQEATQRAKLSAYGTLKSGVAALQAAARGLADGSALKIQTATVSDPAVVAASAGTNAVPASYAIEVTALARSAKLVSNGIDSTSTAVGSGSLTITFGTYDSTGNTFTTNGAKTPVTIAIPASNGTLAGVRDAINAAKSGVTATIVTDTGGARLVMSSTETGARNAIKIDAPGLAAFAYDPTVAGVQAISQLQGAQAQQEISEMVGMTRESINKQLRAWAARNWVRLEHGAIVVLDAASLQAIAEAGGSEGD